jgi:aspartyl-tRNA(Asn)/glutamyl-tRNA(Gln) amidotransferase subunit A
VFPLSTTLDHCGPLTRSVEDAAIALGAIAGFDPLDPASADLPVDDYLSSLQAGVSGLRIGIPRAFFTGVPMASAEVLAAIDRTADALRSAGATVEDVALPDYALYAACGRVIMITEAFAIHEADMRSRPLDYGRITFARFVLGACVTAADLIQAFRLRRELTDALNGVLGHCDALLTASSLIPAPRFDEVAEAMSPAGLMQTMPFNVTGHPALSVPVGLSPAGLPLGVQIVGRPFDEATTLRVGRAVEALSGWESIALPRAESFQAAAN